MTGPLAEIGPSWSAMIDGLADFQADLLRQTHARMADALDRDAQSDVEGARDWRNLQNTGDRYADC